LSKVGINAKILDLTLIIVVLYYYKDNNLTFPKSNTPLME
jgi:hypothetical protein